MCLTHLCRGGDWRWAGRSVGQKKSRRCLGYRCWSPSLACGTIIRPWLLRYVVRPGGTWPTSTLLVRGREREALWVPSSARLPPFPPTVLTLGAISLRSLSLVSSAHSVLWESTHWDCALIWICWCLCALHWPLVALFRWASCWLSLTRIYTIPWCWYLEATGSQLIQWVCCCWCTLLCSS